MLKLLGRLFYFYQIFDINKIQYIVYWDIPSYPSFFFLRSEGKEILIWKSEAFRLGYIMLYL